MVNLRAISHSNSCLQKSELLDHFFSSYLILVIIDGDFKIYMYNVCHILSSQYLDPLLCKDPVLHPKPQTSIVASRTTSLPITAPPPKFNCKQHTFCLPRVYQQFSNSKESKIHLFNYIFTIYYYFDI